MCCDIKKAQLCFVSYAKNSLMYGMSNVESAHKEKWQSMSKSEFPLPSIQQDQKEYKA